MGEIMFDVSLAVVIIFGVAALMMLISDAAVDLFNRFTVGTVNDVTGEVITPSQRPVTWHAEAGSSSPGDPARCPLCLETQPPVDVFFVRAHGQLVCRPCSRLTAAQAYLMRTHQ